MEDNLPSLQERFEKKQLRLIDVRELEEWSTGHILGAIHLPLSNILQGVVLEASKVPYYLYCRSGKRAKIAENVLKAQCDTIVALEVSYDILSQHFPTVSS